MKYNSVWALLLCIVLICIFMLGAHFTSAQEQSLVRREHQSSSILSLNEAAEFSFVEEEEEELFDEEEEEFDVDGFLSELLGEAITLSDRGTSTDLPICSFNIQVFGVKKMKDPMVVKALVTILRQYDVCLIQEIRDSTDTAIWDLLNKINDPSFVGFGNSVIDTHTQQFDIVVSERLGRSNSKEQYGFLYNKKIASVLQTYQYKDEGDRFERPPYSVLFEVKRVGGKSALPLMLTGVHISPQSVSKELEAMYDAYTHMLQDSTLSVKARAALRERWILMGDLNADCSYLSKTAMSKLRLRNDTGFVWLIPDGTDTTVATGSKCTYDRLIVSKAMLNNNQIVTSKVGVFNYRTEFSLNDADTKLVSDHFPVYMTVRLP